MLNTKREVYILIFASVNGNGFIKTQIYESCTITFLSKSGSPLQSSEACKSKRAYDFLCEVHLSISKCMYKLILLKFEIKKTRIFKEFEGLGRRNASIIRSLLEMLI